ncbi:MAG: zinc/manganese transport system substrate-binding protein [Solirubrobacteraceae bacterium]|nr:zinc/manganese transport system substrate-binding protein [Solirubrobacteraceae bacterium]
MRAIRGRLGLVVGLVLAGLAVSGCASSGTTPATFGSGSPGAIVAVGAENEYADVIGQVGGRYVRVSAIESNPNTDPHAFEASPSVARVIGSARLIVQNGLGYDRFMNNVEAATSGSGRRVIDVQKLLGLPDSTANPHLWYRPETMPVVAAAVARGLAEVQPAHAAYFTANAAAFKRSLTGWSDALKAFGERYPRTPVATTEPVGDYMLAAAGSANLSPATLESAVMNGVDPAPQDVTRESGLLSGHRVKVFVYNQQVTDSLTAGFLATARRYGIPVVGVYETMPTPGYDYQSWMVAEVRALEAAVAHRVSTERLR